MNIVSHRKKKKDQERLYRGVRHLRCMQLPFHSMQDTGYSFLNTTWHDPP